MLGGIQAHMLKEASKPSTRRQDIIHPSEVAKTGWCPKATYLRIKRCRELQDPYWKPSETYGVQLLNIFDEGHYIHDKWQKRLWDMGLLWGRWECKVCRCRFIDTSPSTCPNTDCKSKLVTYLEIPLHFDDFLISGHADGGVPSLKSLIEIKSVGTGTARIEAPDIFKANSDGQKIDLPGLWRDIKEPFPAHVRQGQLYLYLCAEMGLDFTQIIFLYESKFNQGAKEFVVKYDYTVIEALMNQVWQIVNALDGGTPNGEDCLVCSKVNLPYPFVCQCVDDPIKCPFGGCKDCDVYGTETTARVGKPTEPIPAERFEGSTATGRGSSGSAKRIKRPTRPRIDGTVH